MKKRLVDLSPYEVIRSLVNTYVIRRVGGVNKMLQVNPNGQGGYDLPWQSVYWAAPCCHPENKEFEVVGQIPSYL